MVRKLKTFQTSLGFYDLAIAAPSMKAALEAWGAGSNLFHQGVAKETDDPDVVAATLSKPGVVLKRPAGSNERVAESDKNGAQQSRRRAKPTRRAAPEVSERAAQKPPPISRRSRSAAKPRAGGRGPRVKEIASGARRRQQKRKRRWMRPSASTKPT